MMILSKRSISEVSIKRQSSPFGSGLKGLLKSPLLLLTYSVMVFLLTNCGKDPEVDATTELAASFEGSPAKEDIIKANAGSEVIFIDLCADRRIIIVLQFIT